MRDKNFAKIGFKINNGFFKRFLLPVSILIMGAACGITPEVKPANDPSVSYRFKGFTLSPPKTEGWYRSETDDKNSAVFRKTLEKNRLFQLSAVVTPFETRLSRKTNEPLHIFLERALTERYRDHAEFSLLSISVKPLTLNKAECVEFEAQQGKRYYPPVLDVLDSGVEYIHQGYICQHPVLPLFIQGLVTEHRLQEVDLQLDKASLQEAQNIIRSIQFISP